MKFLMTGPDTRILATGGASLNRAILQVRKDFTENSKTAHWSNSLYISSSSIWMQMSQSLGMIYGS